MAITLSTVNSIGFDSNTLKVNVTLTTSGNYAQGGVAVNFAIDGVDIPTEYPPTDYHIFEPTAPVTGWQYFFTPGTTLSNGLIQIFNGTTELTATTFPAATLTGIFYFPSL